jgi:hypothetical protein
MRKMTGLGLVVALALGGCGRYDVMGMEKDNPYTDGDGTEAAVLTDEAMARRADAQDKGYPNLALVPDRPADAPTAAELRGSMADLAEPLPEPDRSGGGRPTGAEAGMLSEITAPAAPIRDLPPLEAPAPMEGLSADRIAAASIDFDIPEMSGFSAVPADQPVAKVTYHGDVRPLTVPERSRLGLVAAYAVGAAAEIRLKGSRQGVVDSIADALVAEGVERGSVSTEIDPLLGDTVNIYFTTPDFSIR